MAVQVAEKIGHAFRDGVRCVSLETLSDPALLPHFVSMQLSIVIRGGTSVEDALVKMFQPRRLLLVLDNCEHVLSAAARLVSTLLRSCPYLCILATSREPLALPGEATWSVEPLPVPTDEALDHIEDASNYDAVNLFALRAASALPSFRLTAGNVIHVGQICRKLEGLPLALELAAAWLRVISLQELDSRLENILPLLTRGSPAGPPRHQTLRATLDWSYRLLDDAERSLFARLAVFPGSFSLAAAEHVCLGLDDSDSFVLANLARLVDTSLVLVHDRGEETRFRMLEPIRQYAREWLANLNERERVYRRHQEWCVSFAVLASAELSSPEQGRWLDRMEGEHDNIRAALHWSLAHGDAAGAGQIAAGVWSFWLMRGHLLEGHRWMESILAAKVDSGPLRAHLLWVAGILNRQDRAQAERCFDESIELYQMMENIGGEARSLGSLGFLSQAFGDHVRAIAYLEQSIALLKVVADSETRARVLTGLALSVLAEGDITRAAHLCEESRAMSQELGDMRTGAAAIANLGLVHRVRGDEEGAAALWEESLAVRRNIGDLGGVAHVLALLGRITLNRGGDVHTAAAFLNESHDLRCRIGDERGLALILEGLSAVGATQGHLILAARLAGAAAALRIAVVEPPLPWERDEHERVLNNLQARLDSDAFADAWNHGQALVSDGFPMKDVLAGATKDTEDSVVLRFVPRPGRQADVS